MSRTRLAAVNTQESIHPTSTATTLDIQPLGSPKAPPTPQEIQRKLAVPQRTQKGKNKALNAGQSGTESEEEFTLSPEATHATLGTSVGTNQGLSSIAERPQSGGEESEDDEDELAGGWKAAKPDQHAMIKADQSLQVLHSGSLWKKGNRRKTWKRRWFVLRPSHLAYYKTSAEYKLLRLLDISEIHAVTPVSLKRHENTFGIVTRARTFYLQAETHEEVEVWVARLNEVKDALQPTNLAGAVPIAYPPPPAPSAYQAAIVGSPTSSAKASPTPQLIVPPSPKIVAFSEPSSPIQANANKRHSRTITVTSSDSEIEEPAKTPGTGTTNAKDASKVIMSGYLMKCGSKRKTWRKRWFVLRADKMIYTGSHMDTKPHRELPLRQILDAMEYKSHHHRETKHLGTGGSSTGGSGGIAAAAGTSTGSTSAATAATGGGSGGGGGGGGTLSNSNASTRPTSSGGLSGAEEDAGTLTGMLTGGKFTFKVITPKKTLLLCAPSEEEEVKWIGAIRVLIARRTTAEAGVGHVQAPSGSGASEVNNKKREGKEREKEKEKEGTGTGTGTVGAIGMRKRSISATGLAAAVLGGADKEK